jgi:hypothetical protein
MLYSLKLDNYLRYVLSAVTIKGTHFAHACAHAHTHTRFNVDLNKQQIFPCKALTDCFSKQDQVSLLHSKQNSD